MCDRCVRSAYITYSQQKRLRGKAKEYKGAMFKETLQVTSGNDASGNFCAHDINSLHELCYIFTKIKLPTEKSLKYVAITLIFASHPNSELFSQTK